MNSLMHIKINLLQLKSMYNHCNNLKSMPLSYSQIFQHLQKSYGIKLQKYQIKSLNCYEQINMVLQSKINQKLSIIAQESNLHILRVTTCVFMHFIFLNIKIIWKADFIWFLQSFIQFFIQKQFKLIHSK
ncbi:unnamed protein product [Paramecium pentaurelia]|uniref:Transmembrane protein n=1 Tax=Paramecium pentaurelia TaxID=43138 RepID=A0A8S1T8G4_9CILI|nr:unnamed protein product [Paramecium pentaurelia]